jgi:hypothetical protein
MSQSKRERLMNRKPMKMDEGDNTPADRPSRTAHLCPPWQPGQSGNPAGRPKGAKSKFIEDFWRDLYQTWQEGGVDALKRMMRDMPDKFVTVAAGKIPQEVELTSNTYVIVAPEPCSSTQEWLDSLSVRRPGETIQ